MESMQSWVSPFAGVKLKSDNLSSIGPRAMGKGFGPSLAHFQTICPTLSTICCWLQWLKICLAIYCEVIRERSRAHCFNRGRSSGLSECWMLPNALALLGILWRGDCPCVSSLSAALMCSIPTSWSGVRIQMRPSWEGVMFFLESLWHLTVFGMRARATAVPPEVCSCIRLPWYRFVRDLKSVAASGSLMMSNPVTIPIGLPLATLCPTGKKGVRSVLLESPVARAVTRTIVQASSGMSCIEDRPEDVVSYLVRGQKCTRSCSGVFERMAIIRAICNAHRVTWKQISVCTSTRFHLSVEKEDDPRLCPVDRTFEKGDFHVHAI